MVARPTASSGQFAQFLVNLSTAVRMSALAGNFGACFYGFAVGTAIFIALGVEQLHPGCLQRSLAVLAVSAINSPFEYLITRLCLEEDRMSGVAHESSRSYRRLPLVNRPASQFSYNPHRRISPSILLDKIGVRMNRRSFLKAGASAAIVTLARPNLAFAADAEIQVSPGEPGAVISPHIYGHFIEHLGGVIYDGIWVGRNSTIPNVDGIRKQFIDDMKRIGAPNLRWPGGCFADGYHWRDGIGKASGGRRTYNYWQRRMPAGIDATETNQFGIHEFMRLCRLIGAEPYVAANVGSGTPQEFHDWVSYCNAPAGTVSLAGRARRQR